MRLVKRLSSLWMRAGISLLVLLAVTGSSWAQGLKAGTLRIESVPAAAEVELIGGKAGVTPLTISERDIYPNNYADDRAQMYGIVLLRHPGCEPLRHRVTLSDISEGLHLQLDCGATASPSAAAPPTPAPTLVPPSPVAPEAISQRRLRQLQVLQELLDEGLISPTEEQRIRRRILQPSGGSESQGPA